MQARRAERRYGFLKIIIQIHWQLFICEGQWVFQNNSETLSPGPPEGGKSIKVNRGHRCRFGVGENKHGPGCPLWEELGGRAHPGERNKYALCSLRNVTIISNICCMRKERKTRKAKERALREGAACEGLCLGGQGPWGSFCVERGQEAKARSWAMEMMRSRSRGGPRQISLRA